MTDTATENPSRDQVVRWAYNEATKALREAHADEFRQSQIDFAASKGVEYAPRKTAGEKAREDLMALLEAHPDLEQELIEKIESQVNGK